MRRPMRKPWLIIMNYSEMTRNFKRTLQYFSYAWDCMESDSIYLLFTAAGCRPCLGIPSDSIRQTYEKGALSKPFWGVEKTLGKAMAYNNELFIDGKKCPRNSTILLGNPLKFTELHGLICMEFHGLVEEIENMNFLVCAYPRIAMEFVGIP